MTVSTKTRAFQLTEFDYHKISQAPVELGEVGHHDVLVEMKAASLNYRDFLISQGYYNPNLKLPLVPLSDGAGIVTKVGDKVKRFKEGDLVSSTFFQDWCSGSISQAAASSALGGEIGGVLQAERIFPEHGLVKAPAGYTAEQAATLPCAALTAWNALFEAGNLKPGDKVLVLGTGGVSIFALQLAKAAGATVLATSSSDDKLKRVKELGADYVINYKENPDWEKSVLEATDGVGVDYVVEVGGAGTVEKSIKAVRYGGHISMIGVLSGMGGVDPIKLLMKAIRLQGIFVGSREMFENMNAALAANEIKPIIEKTFPVEQVAEAIDYMKAGKHFGKIVLKF